MTVYFFMIASLLVGILMIFRLRKEDKLYLFLGIGLILLAVWLFVNERLDGLLSTGAYAWAGKGVLAGVAVVLAYFFWLEEKKRRAAMREEAASAEPVYDPETAVLLKDFDDEDMEEEAEEETEETDDDPSEPEDPASEA